MKHAALAILTTLSLVACKPQDPKPLPAEAMAPAPAPVPADRLHLTLHYLGETGDEAAAVLRDRGTGECIALFLGNPVVGVVFVGRRILAGAADGFVGGVLDIGGFFTGGHLGLHGLHGCLGIGLGGDVRSRGFLATDILGVASDVIALFLGDFIGCISLIECRVLPDVACLFLGRGIGFVGLLAGHGIRVGSLLSHLCIGLGRHVGCLGFLSADVLGIAGHVVAFFPGDVIDSVSLRHPDFVVVFDRRLVACLKLRLRNVLAALGFFDADVLGVVPLAAARKLVS